MELDGAWRSIPRLSQYLGAWAIEPGAANRLADLVRRIDAPSHLAAIEGWSVDLPRAAVGRDGTAVLEIRGPVTKYGSSLSEAGSTLRMRQLVRRWADDRKVKSLLLLIDSPGGTVCGTPDLADAVRKFGKPTAAYIEDCGASAAYWIAAACDRVYCNASATVGSIGVYSVLVDSSEQAGMLGLKVHVVSTGPLKGAGVEGTEITPEQLDDAKRGVDSIHSLFTAAVAAGRKMAEKQVESVATGQVWIGEEAVKLGLVDAVATADQARQYLVDATQHGIKIEANMKVKKKGKAAADELRRKRLRAEETAPPLEDEDEEKPVDEAAEDEAMDDDEPEAEDDEDSEPAASLKQLKAALPDSTPEFRERCLEGGYSLAAAKDAWMNELRKQVNGRRGAAPLKTAPAARAHTGSDPISQFEALVREAKASGLTTAQARKRVVHNNPELHEAYIAAVNSGRKKG